MGEIAIRNTIKILCENKKSILSKIKEMEKIDKDMREIFESFDGYSPIRLDFKYDSYDENREEKYVDRSCWNHIVNLFNLHRYMLCTDFEKMRKMVQDCQTPQFTEDNVKEWIGELKGEIIKSVEKMVKNVYESLCTDHYYTGSGYSNRLKKKRNNNGIDKNFI